MPISESFAARLVPRLEGLVALYGSPFHIYDEDGIVRTFRAMRSAFGDEPFAQHFAVKALPNPAVLGILMAEGSGLDCASGPELEVAARLGATGEDVVFTSNNTTIEEYRAASEAGALITFDDLSFFRKVDALPPVVAFRVAPDDIVDVSQLMGGSDHTKFGVPAGEVVNGYREAMARGATRFGIHGMACANELDLGRALAAARAVMEVAARVEHELGLRFAYVNLGGGLGIPYRPEDRALDFAAFARGVLACRNELFAAPYPLLRMECGRFVTGPHGVLVTRVVTRTRKSREIVGLDASMPALMRPAIYGAYHHATLPLAGDRPSCTVDLVGSLCESMDRFAVDRVMPDAREGDIVLIHDTGAHAHAMGFNYNGRLRPAELLLRATGEIVEIRRAERIEDYLATVRWVPEPVMGALSQVGT